MSQPSYADLHAEVKHLHMLNRALMRENTARQEREKWLAARIVELEQENTRLSSIALPSGIYEHA